MTQTEFIEKYRRLCGHIARNFIWRRKRQLEESNGHDNSELSRRNDVDAQDLASAALLRLAKVKEQYWDQPHYVKKAIVTAIIDETRKQEKWFKNEFCPYQGIWITRNRKGTTHGTNDTEDYFDSLPGRDGLATQVQSSHDSATLQEAIQVLTDSERTVITIFFGLNNLQHKRERAIAQSLGKTKFWVERRLHSGLNRLRKEIGLNPLTAFDFTSLSSRKQARTKRIPSYPGQQ
jgi:RNA polymerase sigma factor (sigma-70 family)